jgi:16S rRNA (guanine527-N7)-methyltransferase
MLALVAPLMTPATRLVAMKGRWPPPAGADDSADIPSGWRIDAVRRVAVPGLDAERHLLRLSRP